MEKAERTSQGATGKQRGTRLEFAFRPVEVQTLRQVAALTGEPTLAAVVRNALKVYTWILTQQYNNRRIVAEDQQGKERTELMLLTNVITLDLPNAPQLSPQQWPEERSSQ